MLLLNPTYPILKNYAYGSFTASGPATALGSALKAWMAADDHGTANMTDDGGGLISSWKSHDGSALTVTAAGSVRPVWTSNAITNPSNNPVSGLTFDGTDDCFVSTTLTNIPTGTTAGEVWGLASSNLSGSVQNLCMYGSTANQGARLIGKDSTNFSRVSTISDILVDGHIVFTGIHVMGLQLENNTMFGRIDGLAFNPPSLASAFNTGTTRLRIGASDATTAAVFWNGVIRHVFITTTLTALQRLQLEAWLLWDCGWAQYRLPSNHPFKFRRP